MKLGLRSCGRPLFASTTLLCTLFPIEHVGACHFVLSAAHQSKLYLVLNVLDVNGPSRLGAAAQRLNDLVRKHFHRLPNASGCCCLGPFDGDKGLGNCDGDFAGVEG